MKTRVAELAWIGLLAVGAQCGTAATAVADPPLPTPEDPAAPAPIGGPLAQSNDPAPGIAGLPNLSALGSQLLLGQTSTPALPGTEPSEIPIPNALNNSYLLPQNLVPSAPGEGEIFGVAPGEENADITKRQYLHRLYDSYRAGAFEGGLLGQRSESELDQSLSPPG